MTVTICHFKKDRVSRHDSVSAHKSVLCGFIGSATLSTSLHLKHQDDRAAQHQVTGLSFSYRDLGVTPGIEVHDTESRREAPWIKVRSTEAFLFN